MNRPLSSLFRSSRFPAALALAAALCSAAVPARAEGPKPLTLDEAYAAALRRSEAVAEKGETYAQMMAQIDVLWSQVKPRLNLNATQMWQEVPSPNPYLFPANQQVVAINGHQPLFTGLRDLLAIKASRSQGDSAELAYRRAKQLLYRDVANAYLNLVESRRDIATHEGQVKLTEGRVKELKSFEDIGRSRKSEVLAAEVQQAQDAADLETSKGLERVRQATLQFLTGLDEELAPAEIAVPAEAEDVKPFLDRAQHRSDVEGARKDYEYSDLYVSIQKRGYWPTIFLDGNYYLRRSVSFYQGINWDATLTGQLPIYYGGQIGAQTREAQAQRGYNEQALSLALRMAELDVRTAYSDLESDLAIVKALENAMTLAESNAKAQTADYRHGLVTNIDVLTSLETVQSTRLRLDAAEIQAYYARVRLEVAAGGPAISQ